MNSGTDLQTGLHLINVINGFKGYFVLQLSDRDLKEICFLMCINTLLNSYHLAVTVSD